MSFFTNVVEVDANGQLTAKKAGSATIMANAGDKNDTVTVTVKAKPVRTSTDVYVKWTDRSQARLYYWNDTTNNKPFPGTAMQKVQCGSDSWWKLSVPLTGTFEVIVTGNNKDDKYPANGKPGTTDIPIPGTAASYYIDGWYAPVTEGTPPSGCSVRSAAPARAQAVPSVEPVMDVSNDAAPQAEEATDPSAPHDVDPRVGRFKIENLPNGTYTLKEFKAPTGYWLNTTEYGFTVKNGELTWTAGKEPDVHDNEHWISDVPTEFSWDKIDAGYSESDNVKNGPIAGSEWKLEKFKDGDYTSEIERIEDCQLVAATGCSGSDKNHEAGKFTLKGLAIGKYRLSETKAPEGYNLPENVYYYFELSTKAPGDTSGVVWTKGTGSFDTTSGDPRERSVNTNAAPNYRKTGSVNWTKVNSEDTAENKKPLPGSEWKLTYTSYDKKPGTTEPKETIICALTDTASSCTVNGESKDVAWAAQKDPTAGKFSYTDLPWGDYVIVETKAPDGYYLDTTEHKFTVGPNTEDKFAFDLGAIKNTPGFELPSTGGEGNTQIVLFGFALTAISMLGCAIVMRKRI